MQTFTAFCQDADGRGTIWIDAVTIVEAGDGDTVEAAKAAAREACADAWGYEDASQIHVLGLATGDVQIAYWADLEG